MGYYNYQRLRYIEVDIVITINRDLSMHIIIVLYIGIELEQGPIFCKLGNPLIANLKSDLTLSNPLALHLLLIKK